MRLVLVALALITAVGPATTPRDLTLRLTDVQRGYLLGDDGGCSRMGAEGASARLRDIVRRVPARVCEVQLERKWGTAPPAQQPALVESLALVATVDGAREYLDDAVEFLSYAIAPYGFRLAPERPTLGDEARLVRATDVVIEGHPGNAGVGVVWRSGRVLAAVFASDPVVRRLDARVLELARVQQRRIESPTKLQARELDDREVMLDNPRLGTRVVWLGRRFAPHGLPPLELSRGYGPIGAGGGPGNRVQIDYASADHAYGVNLFLWKPAEWRRFSKTRLGRLVWTSPCAKATRFRVRGGRAVIYSGYAAGATRPCPSSPPDRVLAHVVYRDLAVTVNTPLCYLCVTRGSDPYNAVRGLRAVVRALRVRR
jgi:hypothetical protein